MHERLTRLRKEKKLTQEQLAKNVGITRSALSQYEIGTRSPDYEIVRRIAEYFDVSIDYLVGRTADPKRVLKEQARQLIDMIDLDLTDEEIMSAMNLYVDGQLVEKDEVIIFISLIRANRIRMKQGLAAASQESKK